MKKKRLYNIIKNLFTSNPLVIITAYYRAFIMKQYDNINGGNKTKDIIYMAATHPQCALNGYCEDCGCPFLELTVSDKKCKKL